MYVIYHGDFGGSIYLRKVALEDILKTIRTEKQANLQGKGWWGLQSGSVVKHVIGTLNRAKGTSNADKVKFKYIRINHNSNTALVYENTFFIKGTDVGESFQTIAIKMTINDLLDCLIHISASSPINTRVDVGEAVENDLD